jgi:hypothetical protein
MHVICMVVALGGALITPSAVAPWVCLASHALGAWSHRWPVTHPKEDFLPIVRFSLAIVATLISLGQYGVLGTSGIGYVWLAGSSLVLEWLRPSALNNG